MCLHHRNIRQNAEKNYSTSFKGAGQLKWSAQTVSRILKNVVYIGTLAQGKRTTVSHKVKKEIAVPECDWVVVENAHEAIISRMDFDAVQIPEPVADSVPVKQGKSFRVALYARFPVELKSRPSESIANQLSILREFIRDKAEFAEYHEYVDSAVSGTSFDRPAFGQMMDDVREGKISCIIVKDMSRFGRDYIEASNYIETIFPFLGVRFISVSDHFDTEAEFNQNKALEIALKNLVNDMYAKDISKRVSVSRRLDIERGKFTGSNVPYGYKVDSGDALRKYVIDRDAAAVVRQIFELAADGVTLREIAKALQEYRFALPGDYLKQGISMWRKVQK